MEAILRVLFFNPIVRVGSLSQKGFTWPNGKVPFASLRVPVLWRMVLVWGWRRRDHRSGEASGGYCASPGDWRLYIREIRLPMERRDTELRDILILMMV